MRKFDIEKHERKRDIMITISTKLLLKDHTQYIVAVKRENGGDK